MEAQRSIAPKRSTTQCNTNELMYSCFLLLGKSLLP